MYNFEHFLQKMTLIPDLFPKLQTPTTVVKSISKKSCFRGTLDRQHGERQETQFQSQRQHF